MNALHVIFSIWVALIVGFVGLMVYRGHLTQHETDQLFLSENVDESLIEEHNHIVQLATRIQPYCTGFGGATALVGALILGVYIVQQIPNMRF